MPLFWNCINLLYFRKIVGEIYDMLPQGHLMSLQFYADDT